MTHKHSFKTKDMSKSSKYEFQTVFNELRTFGRQNEEHFNALLDCDHSKNHEN